MNLSKYLFNLRLINKKIPLFKYHQSKLTITKYLFSTLQNDNNPDQLQRQLKRRIEQQQQQQKNKTKSKKQMPILKDINQVVNMEQLDQIYKKFNFMSKNDRELALRYLLTAIYHGKIQFRAITDKKMTVALKQYPYLKLQAQIFQITSICRQIKEVEKQLKQALQQQQLNLLSQKAQLFQKANDLFYKAFNQSLKQIQTQQLNRSKSVLYKHFAQYNFNYLFNSSITSQQKQKHQQNLSFLKKARQFLIQSLKCHKEILLKQYNKMESDEFTKLKQQDNQRYVIRINAIKENIRKLVQSVGECLYAFFKNVNKEYQVTKDTEEFNKKKIQLLSLLEIYLPLYSIIPGIKEISVLYFKLYKIKIQAQFTTVKPPKTQQEAKAKVKSVIQEYSRLYNQCDEGLDQVIELDKFESVKDIVTTMLSIKYMVGRTLKLQQTDLKNELAQGTKDILNKVKPEWKKPLQIYIAKILKQMLQISKN